ncbi:MAG: hypothetical protein ACR2KK_16200 [Acidimicrobiales bacterium]
MSAARAAAGPSPSAGGGATSPDASAFGGSRACFEDIVGWLAGAEAGSSGHGELEEDLDQRGRELLRRLLQDHLDLRLQREERVEVVAADGVSHGSVEAGHTRQLTTVFGAVSVERLAYRHREAANLHPADGALNLPEERHSHGLRRLAAVESPRGSYEEAAKAIGRATGVAVAKRQVEELTARAATDVEDFYDPRAPEPGASDDVLVVSVDGKGIVMRPDSLRPATEKAAAAATTKLETAFPKARSATAKRLAEVGAVYDVAPVPAAPPACWPPRAATTHRRRHGRRPSG